MNPKDITAWLRIGVDTWALGWQAAHVVGLRSARIAAGGPAAGMETWLMLSEKWQSAVEIQSDLLARGPDSNPATTTRRTGQDCSRGKYAWQTTSNARSTR